MQMGLGVLVDRAGTQDFLLKIRLNYCILALIHLFAAVAVLMSL